MTTPMTAMQGICQCFCPCPPCSSCNAYADSLRLKQNDTPTGVMAMPAACIPCITAVDIAASPLVATILHTGVPAGAITFVSTHASSATTFHFATATPLPNPTGTAVSANVHDVAITAGSTTCSPAHVAAGMATVEEMVPADAPLNVRQSRTCMTRQHVPMTARLKHYVDMLDGTILTLQSRLVVQRESNLYLAFEEGLPSSCGAHKNNNDAHATKALRMEHTLIFSLEVLHTIRQYMKSMTDAASILQTLVVAVPLIRIFSVRLFDTVPDCSHRLLEMSVHLGSIAFDSASLTGASLDFGRSSAKSSALFTKLNLTAYSKISDQYPNLDLHTVFSV